MAVKFSRKYIGSEAYISVPTRARDITFSCFLCVNLLCVLYLRVKLNLSEFGESPLSVGLILSQGHSQSTGSLIRHWDALSLSHCWHVLCTFSSWVPPLFLPQSLFRVTDSLAHAWWDGEGTATSLGTMEHSASVFLKPSSSPVSCSPSCWSSDWAEVDTGGSRGKVGSLGDLVSKLPWLPFVIPLFTRLRYR